MKLHRIGVASAVVVAAVAVGPVAHAQDKKALKKIEDANAKAMEEYDLLEFESAKKILNGALVDVKKAGLDKHPVAARTHGNLGIVYEGLGDGDNALLEFISALEIDGKWTPPKEYKKPELQKIFDQARSTVGKGGRPTAQPAPDEPDEPDDGGDADVSGFKHQLVEEAKEGQAIKISTQIGGDLGVEQAAVYYRVKGQEEFSSVPLRKKSGATWEASIPASATRTDSIQYYVEAKSDDGAVAGNSGSRGSPNIIEIARTTSGTGNPDIDESGDNPLATGDADGDDNGVKKSTAGKSKYSVYVNISVGSGAGYVSGNTEQSTEPVKAGVAPSPFHVMPELGFWLSPQLTLSIYGRIGLPVGANIPGHAPAAPAGLVRMTYHLGSVDGLSVHGDIGGGFLRHTVGLKVPYAPDPDKPNDTGDVDTVASGPLIAGGGLAWSTTLSGPLRFVLDANLLAGIPVVSELGSVKPEFAVNADLNLGFQLAF